jgi:hypothetical protein
MSQKPLSEEALVKLQRDTFGYFKHETNLRNGLVPDKTQKESHASIAAIGLGLAAYPVGVERNFISREEAVDRVLTTLRFFGTAHRESNLMRPVIKASTITFFTWIQGAVRGPANSQPSTRPF